MDYCGIKIKKFMIYNSEIITYLLTHSIKTQVIKTQEGYNNKHIIKTQVIIINKHTYVI